MATTLEEARRFQELLTEQDPQFAFSTIFDDSGYRARRRSKWKFKMLVRIGPKLRAVLRDGETLRYLTRGTRFSFWESYFLGWVMNLINRRAIVVTNHRIILVQISYRLKPRHLVEHIRYPAIRKVDRTLLGNARLYLNDGKKVVFAYVPRADRVFLGKLTDYTRERVQHENAGIEDLCPFCYDTVRRPILECPSCGGTFKSPRTAALRSLMFPGLGDWYLDHNILAAFEILFAVIVWSSLFAPNPEYPFTLLGFAVGAVILVVFVHGPDALLTHYVARRGVYPDRPPPKDAG